jgi:hypothetical protein
VIHWRHRLLALVAVLAIAPETPASVFEYLYVEANAGSSAGGHFALRLDDWVYDFQNAEIGTLRLRRTRYDFFRYLYTVLENRTMHIARVDVPRETHQAISDRFNRRYLIQNQHFSVLDSLRGDREWIQRLLARAERPMRSASDWGGVAIRGAGFFYDGASVDAGRESASLRALRDRVASDRGTSYIADRIAELERVAESLAPVPEATPASVVLDRDTRPERGYSFSDRYRDLAAKIVALRVLANATRLQPIARRAPSGDEYELSAAEARGIRAYVERLEVHLARLVTSQRPDWGYSLLLGMARLQTLRESLALGRWVVLDSVPANSEFLSRRAVKRRDAFVVELRDRARADFTEARSHFATTGDPAEPALAWLEEAINRYAVFQRGFEQDLAIPIYELGSLPDRAAAVDDLPLPDVDPQILRSAAETTEAMERAYLAAIKRDFGYQLVSNNCVTEIFATIGAEWRPALAGDRSPLDDDPDGLLNFIPFVAYRTVLDTHADAEVSEIPSLRRFRLEQMYATENDVGVYLRESNTLTSTIYRRNDTDPFFLFFTEAAPVLRPIYGALNLAAGIGEMALGALRAPWDRGEMFTSGIKGAVFSLPELLFVNLRKGILEYAPGDTPRTPRRPARRAASSAESILADGG